MKKLFLSVIAIFVMGHCGPISSPASAQDVSVPAVSAPIQSAPTPAEKTPAEKMKSRYPQPVKVSDLIGLPVLDARDRTLGYVEKVVRSSEGMVRLIVPYSSWLGWPRHVGPFESVRRPVAVPIETVVILGRQIDALDMDRSEFDRAPAWTGQNEKPIPADEIIKIAIGRR